MQKALRTKGVEQAHSPGQRPGYSAITTNIRPTGAKDYYNQEFENLRIFLPAADELMRIRESALDVAT
ncbi:MAG: hypothetical protein K6C10_06920 [Prevotella sp.]|nr:hypothetical protein [Prevotella sp.]